MKVDIEAKRKINRLISSLPENMLDTLVEELSNEGSTEQTDLVGFLDLQRESNWKLVDYRTLWSFAEIAHFFDLWVSPFKISKFDLSLTQIRKKIKGTTFSNEQLIFLELSYDPKIYFIARTPTNYRSLLDKTLTTDDVRDAVYIMPGLGIILTALHSDEHGQELARIIQENLTGDWEPFRIRSLIITKLFNTDRWINELVVSADPQISGFDGLDDIRFTGPDVKKGLAGLYRRHDIRVYIHQIGPNIAVENENIRLQVGNQMKIRSIEGLFELHMLMYAEEYPTEDQIKGLITQFDKIKPMEDEIMQLKRDNYENLDGIQPEMDQIRKKIEEISQYKLADLAREWKLDQLRVEYRLSKAISNGLIKAKFIEDSIVKT